MAAGKIVEALMAKAPPPEAMGDAGEAEEGGEDTEASAMEDFLSALGLPAEKAAAALPALKDIIRACMKPDAY